MFEENTSAAQDALVVIGSSRAEATQLEAGSFDAIVLLPNSFRTAWSARQAGIPQRWGYSGSFRGALLTRRVAKPRGRLHQSAYYLEARSRPRDRAARGTSARHRSRRDARPRRELLAPHLPKRPDRRHGAWRRVRPRQALASGAHGRLAVRLARERGATCVLVGVAGDRDAGRAIESAMPSDVRI